MKISFFNRDVSSRRLGVFVGVSLGALLPSVCALEIKLPAETAALAPSAHPGYAAAMTYCATCHSAEYVRMQPPNMTPIYWKATVTKMKKAFGAPIPDDQLDVITDYLVKTYGSGQAVPLAPQGGTPGVKKNGG
jgi:sulfite dehydrogenase